MTRLPSDPPPLSPEGIDRILDTVARSRPEKLWRRPAIAAALGVSEDTVSSWAKIPGVPIFEPLPGIYFARRSEIERWLRTKQTAG